MPTMINDHVKNVQAALKFVPPTHDNIASLKDEPSRLSAILTSVFLRTVAFHRNGIRYGYRQLPQNSFWARAGFLGRAFIGWHNKGLGLTSTKEVLLTPFTIIQNLTKLVTEFLPGVIHELAQDFVETAFNRPYFSVTHSPYREFAKTLLMQALALPIAIISLASLLAYDLGRAFTSPIASAQAALHYISDDYKKRNPIRAYLITEFLFALSLTATTVVWAAFLMVALPQLLLLGAGSSVLFIANASNAISATLVTIGQGVSALVNTAAISSAVSTYLGVNLGLSSALTIGIGAISAASAFVATFASNVFYQGFSEVYNKFKLWQENRSSSAAPQIVPAVSPSPSASSTGRVREAVAAIPSAPSTDSVKAVAAIPSASSTDSVKAVDGAGVDGGDSDSNDNNVVLPFAEFFGPCHADADDPTEDSLITAAQSSNAEVNTSSKTVLPASGTGVMDITDLQVGDHGLFATPKSSPASSDEDDATPLLRRRANGRSSDND